MANKTCLICAEDYSVSEGRDRVHLGCCNKKLCRDCFYSHIKSILEEGITGDGRRSLKCPYGCGYDIGDSEIRDCFRIHHQSLLRIYLGPLIYMILHFVLSFMCRIESSERIFDVQEQHKLYAILTKTEDERRDLDLYESWSLSIALSSSQTWIDGEDEPGRDTKDEKKKKPEEDRGNADQYYVSYVRCPQPDCECLWFFNKKYRNDKLAHERYYGGRTGGSSGGGGKPLFGLKSWFFKPLDPSKEESIMSQNGYTTAHWKAAEEINPNSRKSGEAMTRRRELDHLIQDEGRDKDGRRMTCPKCHFQFCGLCSHPWASMSRTSGRRIFHTNRLCSSYSKKVVGVDDDFFATADAVDARICPGCSLRTSRIDGCNHMTCNCGYEWCYVCECRWDQRHYGCTDASPLGGGEEVCIIS